MLLVIPDISGFTEFVHSTAIEHSQHIISELLEVIIDANDSGLEVSEIEGDAVLFFRFGEDRDGAEVVRQAERMYKAFHGHLLQYDRDRICQCGACSSAIDLTLKVVAHRGEAGEMRIKEHRKLIGEDVIVAHRLLKNDVPGSEYVLLSCIPEPDGDWQSGAQEDKSLGSLLYSYKDISALRDEVELPAVQPPVFNAHPNPVFAEIQIEAPLTRVYEMMTDYDERVRWTPGLTQIKFDRSRIPRVGTKHVCVVNGKDLDVEAISARRLDGGEVEILERNDSVPVLGSIIAKLQLSGNENLSNVRMEIHPQNPGFLGRMMFKFARGCMTKSFCGSLEVLKETAEAEVRENSEQRTPEPV